MDKGPNQQPHRSIKVGLVVERIALTRRCRSIEQIIRNIAEIIDPDSANSRTLAKGIAVTSKPDIPASVHPRLQ